MIGNWRYWDWKFIIIVSSLSFLLLFGMSITLCPYMDLPISKSPGVIGDKFTRHSRI